MSREKRSSCFQEQRHSREVKATVVCGELKETEYRE